jgi:hypothetical protein
VDISGKAKSLHGLWWVLGGGFLVRLALALANLQTLLALSIPDDAFYYFKIAENIASGRGSTFDGIHATNGYHPLWMGFLIPLFRAFPGSPELAVTLALVEQACLDVATAVFVYLLAQAMFSDRTWAILACALYSFNPHTVFYAIDGMETALSTLLAVVVFYFYLSLESSARNTLLARVRFATACGLLLLARTDNIFLCALLFTALAVQEWKQHATLRKTFGMGVIVAVFLAPWLAWSYARFHQFVQVSALARPWVARQKLRGLWIQSGLQLFSRELTVHWPTLSCLLAGYFILLGISWFLLRRPGTRPHVCEKGLGMLSLAWAALFITVAFHCFARLYVRPWYSALFLVLNALTIAWASQKISRLPGARGGVAVLMGIIFAAYVVQATETIWTKKYPWQAEMARAADWINLHTSPKARIGAFNAGIIGFFSQRTVLNLDGVVNNSAYEALRAHRLHDYLLANSVDYVADFKYSVEVDYADFWGSSRDRMGLAPVQDFPRSGAEWEATFMQVYKVRGSPVVPTSKSGP